MLEMKKMMKRGRLIKNDVRLEPQEERTVEFFLERGENIELLVPSYTVGRMNADLLMRGRIWEVKGPVSVNLNTLEVTFKKAVKQSKYLIFDLRRLRRDYDVMRRLQRRFSESKRVKEMLIITKAGELLELRKDTCKNSKSNVQ